MNSQEISTAVLEWIRETLPALEGGYDFIPTMSDQPLPDVVVDVSTVETAMGDPRFPFQAIQQMWLKIYAVDLSFMVDNTDPAAAAETVRGFEGTLTASLLTDGSLGGRVPFISPYFSFDFTPPFVERSDGTRGREMTMQLRVGELIQEEL